jgi:hypothetical protein
VLEARHPTSHHGNLTDQQGHHLGVRLKALSHEVLTCWRLNYQPLSLSGRGGRSPLVLHFQYMEQSQPPMQADRHRWSSLGLLLLLGSVVGAAIGYGLARAFPASHGAPHSCPGGAPTSSCFYPPNQGAHQALFAVAGAVILSFIVFIAWREFIADR